jgi:hypothetical protein
MKLLSKFWKVVKRFKPLSQREVIELYLAQATDLQDLERRMKKVYNTGL